MTIQSDIKKLAEQVAKRVRSDVGDLEISTPRDRDSSFDPTLVSKHQAHISGLDDQIIFFILKVKRPLRSLIPLKSYMTLIYQAAQFQESRTTF